MKTIISYSIALVLSAVLFIQSSFAQITAVSADPAVVTITQQSPTDPSPVGISIAGNTVFKFRVTNNGTDTDPAKSTIPAGAVTYVIQFNPYYTFTSLLATNRFAVTGSNANDYVVQLTNSEPILEGEVLDFYFNVKPTQNTTTPAGEPVTLQVNINVPATSNNQEGNDFVSKSFIVAAGASLPVRSVHLGSTSNASTVNLKWVTESEYNTEKFVIERSVDGRSFSAIGESKAAGNTSSATSYTSSDDIRAIATKPVLFYRIKVVDTDGKYSYSNTIAIRLAKQTKAQVWPSPFSSQLNVQVEQEAGATLDVKIYNMTGVLVYNKRQTTTAGTNTIQLVDQVSKLSAGMYVIELVSNNSKIYSETIVKQ